MSRPSSPTILAPPIVASSADLSPAVVASLDAPAEPRFAVVPSGAVPFATRSWGDPAAPPLLLIHGVTASSRIWWRIGPALAVGLNRCVVAVDQAGHGRTGQWTGHHRFADNAADMAGFIAAAGLDQPDLLVVGHSWGGMTAAALPGAGIRPAALVLLDPPAVQLTSLVTMLDDPIERHYDDMAEALSALGELHPTWPYGDLVAKAEALTQFDEPAVVAILTENGDWDGGLAGIVDPAAAGLAVQVVRGEPAAGGLIPDEAAVRLAAVVGAENVFTIAGGSHTPMRMRPEATVLALLRAFGRA